MNQLVMWGVLVIFTFDLNVYILRVKKKVSGPISNLQSGISIAFGFLVFELMEDWL